MQTTSTTARPAAPRPSRNWSVEPTTGALGVVVTGLDIRDDAAVEANMEALKDLVRKHKLVVFRGQTIAEDDLDRFGSRWGTLGKSVAAFNDGKTPTVQYITNLDKDGKPSKVPHRNSNYYWHSDRMVYRNGLAMVMLYGQEMPPKGGDTQWVDLQAAYDGLSEADRTLVNGLRAIHSFEYMRNELTKQPLEEAERKLVPPPIEHPLVRTDPDTGRKSLLLGMYACEIVGMPTAQGRALIQRLTEHATQPKYMYNHVWTQGDFAIWDNLSTMHRAVPNYDMEGYRRIMMRCAVESPRAIQ